MQGNRQREAEALLQLSFVIWPGLKANTDAPRGAAGRSQMFGQNGSVPPLAQETGTQARLAHLDTSTHTWPELIYIYSFVHMYSNVVSLSSN